VTIFLEILAVLLIVLGNAFFVAAEYSLVTARRNRLGELAAAGSRRARTAVRLIDDPVRFISTSQLGVTVFSILLGAVGEPLAANWLDAIPAATVSFILAFAIVTYLHVVLGECADRHVAIWCKTYATTGGHHERARRVREMWPFADRRIRKRP